MKAEKVSIESIDEENGEEAAQDIKSEVSPEVVIVYFTVEHSSREEIQSFTESLNETLPDETIVAGVSISSYMSDEQTSVTTTGGILLGLEGVDASYEKLDADPWTTDPDAVKEKLESSISEDKANFVFKTGARQGESSSKSWEVVQKLVLRFQKQSYLQETIIDRINSVARKNKIGYSVPANTAIKQLNREGTPFLVSASTDGGSYLQGYEILNSEVMQSEGLVNLSIDDDSIKIEHPTDKSKKPEEMNVIETYTEIESYKNIITTLDGERFTELKEDLPISSGGLERGGFSYYCYLVSEETSTAFPIPDTSVIVGSRSFEEEIEELLIVRTPSYSEFAESTVDHLPEDREDNMVQVNLHSSLMDFYGAKINDLAEQIDRDQDNWFAVIGDVWKSTRYENFMYPATVEYSLEAENQ